MKETLHALTADADGERLTVALERASKWHAAKGRAVEYPTNLWNVIPPAPAGWAGEAASAAEGSVT